MGKRPVYAMSVERDRTIRGSKVSAPHARLINKNINF